MFVPEQYLPLKSDRGSPGGVIFLILKLRVFPSCLLVKISPGFRNGGLGQKLFKPSINCSIVWGGESLYEGEER